nr:tetratricopeptide repeat protein [Pseudopontixanthobacter vadosimaris]
MLREVDDAVRQDRYSDFAQRFGIPLIVLLVLVLAAFAGWLFWQSRQEGEMERRSEALIGALDQIEAGNLDTGGELLEPLATGDAAGPQSAARMLQAGIALEQGRADDAARLFAAVGADEDAPAALRDLATIREVATRFDSLPPQQVINRLEGLAVPGNPFFGSAAELVAMAHLEAGNTQRAGNLFAEIAKAGDVPDSLRSRARQIAGQLGVDAIVDVEALLAQQGAGAATGPSAGAVQQTPEATR